MTTAALLLATLALPTNSQDLIQNGDFEAGDLGGWEIVETDISEFYVSPANAFSGGFSGWIYNQSTNSTALLRQANLAAGQVNPGDIIEVRFAAAATTDDGALAYAEVLSEVAGGGSSSSEVLGGGPLPLNSTWQTFEFTTVAGPDVGGGITLQLAAQTGLTAYSFISLQLDEVSMRVLSGDGSESYCDAGPNTDGETCNLSIDGSVSLAANDLELIATGVSSLSNAGLFVMGDTQAALPFGSGTLCVAPGGAFYRLNPVETYSDVDVVARLLDTSSGPGAIPQAGETWNFQFWYRDGGTTNLSDGLAVCFQP